jgi:hypothetical protein
MTAFEGVVTIVRLIIGIFSVLAFGIGIALAIVNGMLSNEIEIDALGAGSSAAMLAFSAAFAAAGIVGIARRNHQGSDVIAGVLYWLAAAIGLTGLSIDGGVLIWSIPLFVWIIVAALFGAVFMSPARSFRAGGGGLS